MRGINKMKRVPDEYCKINISKAVDKDYPYSFSCRCGNVIHFKMISNREPYEAVAVYCPVCDRVVVYRSKEEE